jgi:uncharacterized protein YdaU (DUF1376 family)
MSKDPAFLFYPGDWLGGTLGMTFEEKGAYIELLMLQFNRGHMGGHMIGQVVGQLWDKIQVKFIQDDQGLWYNVRLDIEKQKRQSFINSRKNNIKGENQYSKKRVKKSGHMDGHKTTHMENENTLCYNLTETEKILLESETWKESVARNYNIDLQKVDELIKKFISNCKVQDIKIRSMGESKIHFSGWANKNKDLIQEKKAFSGMCR